jgi:hypothetical protein
MTRADQIREKDDVQLADWICSVQPDCDKCKFLQCGHCMVAEYVKEEVNEQANRRGCVKAKIRS